MTKNPTISELLSLSDSQYRIFDVGRKIDKISKSQFDKIEHNQLPYPSPSQGFAFIAIAFWQKRSDSPYLWFVKLPLDERGLLVLASRDHFVSIIVEALGSDLSVDPSERQEELLKSNPYHFTPSQYKLAFINSLLKVTIKEPASQYFHTVIEYLSSTEKWDNWHNIGVQGLTDLATRFKDEGYDHLLSNAFKHLPNEVLFPLCSALENVELPLCLIEAILEKLTNNENSPEIETVLTRALASSCNHSLVVQYFSTLFEQKTSAVSDETLIVVAGRCWQVLDTPEQMMKFLELLIKADDNLLFPAIFKDLVALPLLRPILFQCMRDPNRSPALSQAIGQLFHQVAK